MLYDTGNYKLAKPRELSYKEIKAIAVKEYNILFPDANDFLDLGHTCMDKGKYKLGSFQLHQACERYYNAIGLVFNNYKPKTHELAELEAKMKSYSPTLIAAFPQNTDFEKRCYNLLCRAYIEARYNPEFVVTEEELAYMLERTEILKTITDRICTEKIKSYDNLIAGQEVHQK